jgi:endonuclease YncB( thermonuclease family)
MGCLFSKKSAINLQDASIDNSSEFGLTGVCCQTKVVDVYDGDTLTLAFIFRDQIYHKKCRVFGVDCAEIRTKNLAEKKHGYEAKNFVQNLILNKIVWSEFSDKNDKYGRFLVKIYPEKNGQSLDQILIHQGLGYEYHGQKKMDFDQWYNKIEIK